MASLFVTLRLTGHVSNGEAREFVARLTDLAEAADLAGIEVKQSVDVRLDPEPVVFGFDAAELPDTTAVVVTDPLSGLVMRTDLAVVTDGPDGPEVVIPFETPEPA